MILLQVTNQSNWQKSIEVWRLVGDQLVLRQEHPITLTEDSATVKTVAERISLEVYDGTPVVLLNYKNLPIPDVEETRGEPTYQ